MPFYKPASAGGAAGDGVVVWLTTPTGSGSWNPPPAGTLMLVEAVGAAGGASGGDDSNSGSGGGGGAYAASYIVSDGNPYAYVIGDGGSWTDTTFGGVLVADAAQDGTGGLASNSTGDITFDGGDGDAGFTHPSPGGGGGGCGGPFGAGGAGSGADYGESNVWLADATTRSRGGQGGNEGENGESAVGFGCGPGGGGSISEGSTSEGSTVGGAIRISYLLS